VGNYVTHHYEWHNDTNGHRLEAETLPFKGIGIRLTVPGDGPQFDRSTKTVRIEMPPQALAELKQFLSIAALYPGQEGERG